MVDVFSTTTPPPSSGWSWTDYVFWMTIHGFDTLAGTLKDVCSTHGCVHSPTSIDPSCKSKKWECRKSGERGSHQRRNIYWMFRCGHEVQGASTNPNHHLSGQTMFFGWTDYVFWMTIHGFDTLAGTLKDVCSTHGCVHSPTSIDPSCKSKKWECRKSGERGSHQRRNIYIYLYYIYHI